MRIAAVMALGLCFMLAVAVGSWAVEGPPGVSASAHNMSASGTVPSSEDEICIFCHTPHGGDTSFGMPLWNRSNPVNSGWVFYNSNTLSAAGKPTTINVESLMCLSCHDGSVAVNRLINPSNDLTPIGEIGQNPDFGGGIWTYVEGGNAFPWVGIHSKRIGGVPDLTASETGYTTNDTHNLSDDHPVSINYNAAYGLDMSGLRDPAIAEGRGVRFYGTAPERRVECPSCHDPHVNYKGSAGGNEDYRPFLMTTNSYSYLCLSCHNK